MTRKVPSHHCVAEHDVSRSYQPSTTGIAAYYQAEQAGGLAVCPPLPRVPSSHHLHGESPAEEVRHNLLLFKNTCDVMNTSAVMNTCDVMNTSAVMNTCDVAKQSIRDNNCFQYLNSPLLFFPIIHVDSYFKPTYRTHEEICAFRSAALVTYHSKTLSH